jgi:hypothetical protein
MPASLIAILTSRCTLSGEAWWRHVTHERWSPESLADGKTYCHAHSLVAHWYLRASAYGR